MTAQKPALDFRRRRPRKLLSSNALVAAVAVVCIAALVLSIYPGRPNDWLFLAMLLALFAAPGVLVVAVVASFVLYRRGRLRFGPVPWAHIGAVVLMLFVTYAAFKFYVPRRIAFAWSRAAFQQIVDDAAEKKDDPDFNRRVGPYFVDEFLHDERGGAYLRVYVGFDGIGPDVMSYGFCYEPNRDGSPFGADEYRTFRLGDGWYWFRASDDYF